MQPDDRPDLAAMVVPLGRALIDLEVPVLRAHQITMWGYSVLLGLADDPEEPVRTQAALAQAIGADKTRLIPVLDELQDRGLIDRVPDPADRRARLLTLTRAGRRMRESIQKDIRENEERFLRVLSSAQRRAFLDGLQSLWEEHCQ